MNKYNNIKTEYPGKTFDSKKECERYIYLQHLQKKGKISGLVWQKKFQLVPLQRENGVVVERPIYYIADFVYYDSNGKMVVEDVKGCKSGAAYREFVMKRKLMLWINHIRVREV